MLEAVPGGVVHVAVDGSIVEANAEALRILGFHFDEMQRRYIADWDPVTVHEDGRPCPLDEYPVALVLRTGKPQGPITIGIQRPDGEISWAVFRAMPTHTSNGTLSGAIVTFLDITDRKRVEEALVRSEEKWRSLATHMPDFVVIGGPDGKIHSINRVLPGYEHDKVIGSYGWNFVAEPLRDEWRRRYMEVVESGKVGRFDTRTDAGGVVIWYETILVPLLEDGKTARMVWVARDVTEQRTMMSKLAEKERLASVGMVAASVAHEIMNPLTYVLANLDFARSDKCDSEERRARALTDAREGAARMQQIVWDLRSLGRSGSEELFYVDVRAVLETSLRLASPEIGGRNAKLIVELPEVPGVLASESRLCQVFINLLVNAAQAMESTPPEERELHVTTRTNEDESLVAVDISDTGMGIPPVQLGRIFDPFYTTKRSGTGLGLSISRDCIERMGGRIDVTSEPGHGTTFTVWLSTQRTPRPNT